VRHKRGGSQWGIEAHTEEEQSVRRWCGGSKHNIEADAEEEQSVRRRGYWYNVEAHLKRRIFATDEIDYVSAFVAIDE
jgi:hypothetical protein